MSAWGFSSETFPKIKVEFSIPEGELVYTFSTGRRGARRYPLAYSSIEGIFLFNGEKPEESYIRIPPFHVRTKGIDIGLQADMTDLTTLPLVKAKLNLKANLEQTVEYLNLTDMPVDLRGDVDFDSDMRFNIRALSLAGLKEGLLDLRADGRLKVGYAEAGLPGRGTIISAKDLEAEISDLMAAVTPMGFGASRAGVHMRVSQLSAATRAGKFFAEGLEMNSSTALESSRAMRNLRGALPFTYSLTSDTLGFDSPESGLKVRAQGCRIINPEGRRPATVKELMESGVAFSAARLQAHLPAGKGLDEIDISRPELFIAASPVSKKDFQRELDAIPDTIPAYVPEIAGDIKHTPEMLSFALPREARALLSSLPFGVKAKAKGVRLAAGDNGNLAEIRNLDMAADNDSFRLHNAEMRINDTRATLMASVGNLKDFLTLPASEKNCLRLAGEVAVDTLDINAIARSYVESKGGMRNIPEHHGVSAADSMALIIPRNVDAHFIFKSRETKYINLKFYNILADINASKGNLKIPQLDISTDFGRAALQMEYATSDLQRMALAADVDVTNVNIVNFFHNFPALLKMMPQMKNLTGVLSAGVQAKVNVFPDMYLDVPSAACNITVGGRELKVHQSKFIRKITKMMLIRTDDDIRIKNMDVHASVHGNILQLDPFDFEFDRYKLNMLGVNNFNGNLYYHIAVMKSPVPFPFSVNITGLFRNPQLSFGGPSYDLKRSEEITSDIDKTFEVNLTAVTRRILRLFIKKGAEY